MKSKRQIVSLDEDDDEVYTGPNFISEEVRQVLNESNNSTALIVDEEFDHMLHLSVERQDVIIAAAIEEFPIMEQSTVIVISKDIFIYLVVSGFSCWVELATQFSLRVLWKSEKVKRVEV